MLHNAMDPGTSKLVTEHELQVAVPVLIPGTGPIDVLTDVDTATVAPTKGQRLAWDGNIWIPHSSYEEGLLANLPAPTSRLPGDAYYATDNNGGQLYRVNPAGTAWSATGPPANVTSSPTGPAGGNLSGTYPNPSLASASITNSMVAANAAVDESKLNLATDAVAGTASRRTLGTGAQQAAAGNDSRFSALLGITAYAPGGGSNYTTSGLTYSVMDQTNLQVTFVAPSSGNVMLTMSAGVKVSATTANGFWAFGTSGTGNIIVQTTAITTLATLNRMTARFYITGLTPGQSYTYWWMHAAGGSVTITTTVGSVFNQGLMEVWRA